MKHVKRYVAFLFLCLISAGSWASAELENPQACLSYTARVWGVHWALLLAIHEVEGGKPGTIAWNRNKTYDMGPMQFNSATVADLAKYGVREEHMRYSECASFYVAGWKLATSAHKFRDWRLAIAAYNCGDGAVERALKKRGGRINDISELDIPKRTRTHYVPSVLAAWGRFARRGG
ncbi:transglycosylase SLT domain-containing protein (plasmid) [Methylocaldum gracile subsp. desertum]|uniref:transglycosylase SLT domain-containing protein n=1 Tax=Methylocaldum sp. GT1BW TaxID=3438964 RepID=UPI003D9FC0FC